MLRVTAHVSASQATGLPFDLIVLQHDERRVRRKLLTLVHGDEVLVDFPQAVTLLDRDRLLLEDGRSVEVIAAEEPLYAITAPTPADLTRLAWHIGNRHLPAQIETARILIRRDKVIRTMLLGLGATVVEVSEPFSPEHGAYHGHDHGGAGENHALLYRK